MFCDELKLKLVAGKGGDGFVSFRREKFVPRGGPDGGDGGNGANIIFKVNTNLNTLGHLANRKTYKAKPGVGGKKKNMHGKNAEHLILDGEKMSKSLNNFKYAKDLFTEFSPLDVRYFSLATHYRAPLEFTLQAMQAAVNARYRLQNFYNFIFKYKDFHSEEQAIDELVETAYLDFEKAMDDDFQISQALAVLFDFSHQIYALDALSEQNIELIKEFLTKINSVLAIFKTDLVVSAEAKAMAEKRLQARAAKDYALSDQLRLEIRALGYEIRDSGDSYDLY